MDSHYNPDLLNQGLIPKDSVSLRDQFAMAAVTGLLANIGMSTTSGNSAITAEQAYRVADALLAERDKKR